MKNKMSFLLGIFAMALMSAGWPGSAGATIRERLVVSARRAAECPNAGYTKIQDAVNAASDGDEIHICKGVYVEQVSINKSLDIDADSGAILMPGAMKANTTSLFDSSPIATALLIKDAPRVWIDGLTVDGANNGISECAPDLIGISFQNASGTLSHVAVRNFKLAASVNGCQSGTGVFVQSGAAGVSIVAINHCTIHDFQKNGITADEIGTTAAIRQNVVTGIGSTNGAAQNGVQIGFGAGGSIVDNVVTNNVWAPCTAIATCTTVATNILVTQSDGVEVSGNSAGISQVNIFVESDNAKVENNKTFASTVFDGIRIQGNQSRVKENHVFNGSEAGIFISGNNNSVTENTINEATIGILKDTGSTGNIIADNHFFNAPISVQDPPAVDLSKLISPKR